MAANKTELVKQAYAYGSSVALIELGYDRRTAEETAVKLAEEAPLHLRTPQDSSLVKKAYAYGAAAALKEAGYADSEIEQIAIKLAEAARF